MLFSEKSPCQPTKLRRRILILTAHAFLPGYRKASTHFVTQNWAAQGHEVHVLSIGHSWLTLIKDRRRFKAFAGTQWNRFAQIAPGLFAAAYLPAIHAFSSQNRLLNAVNKPAFALYGRSLPAFARREAEKADLIVIESGSALAFFDSLKRANPKARTLYFCRDLLKSVGAAPALQDIERNSISQFDLVCVPSAMLRDQLPSGGNVRVIPQGIDADLFDRVNPSPYQAGTKNAVSVGDMLFDEGVVMEMALAAPEIAFHIFGAAWKGAKPANVITHGEQAFERIVPYIQHADIGLAPYRLSEGELYLAESSLKLPQYSYCGLPILMPDLIPYRHSNTVTYALDGETDWRARIDAALARPRARHLRRQIPTWSAVAAETLDAVFAPTDEAINADPRSAGQGSVEGVA